MERIKRHLRSAAGYLAVCAKWLVLAALVYVLFVRVLGVSLPAGWLPWM